MLLGMFGISYYCSSMLSEYCIRGIPAAEIRRLLLKFDKPAWSYDDATNDPAALFIRAAAGTMLAPPRLRLSASKTRQDNSTPSRYGNSSSLTSILAPFFARPLSPGMAECSLATVLSVPASTSYPIMRELISLVTRMAAPARRADSKLRTTAHSR